MSNKRNHRRGDTARNTNHTGTGPTWENRNPSAGCNSTHVARARRWWRDAGRRAERRTGRRGANKVRYERFGSRPSPMEDVMDPELYAKIDDGTLCIRCFRTDATEEGQLCGPCARPTNELPPPASHECCYICASPLPEPIPHGQDSRCERCKEPTRSSP